MIRSQTAPSAALALLLASTVLVSPTRADGPTPITDCSDGSAIAADMAAGGSYVFQCDGVAQLPGTTTRSGGALSLDATGHNVTLTSSFGALGQRFMEVDGGTVTLTHIAVSGWTLSAGGNGANGSVGTPGTDGTNGTNNSNSVGDGTNGTPGGPGGSGTAGADGAGVEQGGAIRIMAGGTVVLDHMTFSSNQAVGQAGGNGGHGGGGGRGGSGGASGAQGGNGGNGAASGNGGNGGRGGDGSDAQGGAIWNSGHLTITSSTFTSNKATAGQGGFGGNGGFVWPGGAGGIGGDHTQQDLSGQDVGDGGNGGDAGVAGNAARGGTGGSASGGAIYNTGTLTLTGSTFSSNQARAGHAGDGGNNLQSYNVPPTGSYGSGSVGGKGGDSGSWDRNQNGGNNPPQIAGAGHGGNAGGPGGPGTSAPGGSAGSAFAGALFDGGTATSGSGNTFNSNSATAFNGGVGGDGGNGGGGQFGGGSPFGGPAGSNTDPSAGADGSSGGNGGSATGGAFVTLADLAASCSGNSVTAGAGGAGGKGGPGGSRFQGPTAASGVDGAAGAAGTATSPQASKCSGPGTIEGTLISTQGDPNGHPVAGFTVKIDGADSLGTPVHTSAASDASGHYSALVDPGTYSVSVIGDPPGESGGLWRATGCNGSSATGATCSVQVAPASVVGVSFTYQAGDPAAEDLEITQAVQDITWHGGPTTVSTPELGDLNAAPYTGVGLAAGKDTIVRFYAHNEQPGAASSVRAALRGYSVTPSGLVPLPGSPLSATPSRRDLPSGVVLPDARVDPAGAYEFALPEAWTHGRITLVAGVDPDRDFPDCTGCRANDHFGLANVSFTETIRTEIDSVAFYDSFAGVGLPLNPVRAMAPFTPLLPLAPGKLTLPSSLGSVDLSPQLKKLIADEGLPQADLKLCDWLQDETCVDLMTNLMAADESRLLADWGLAAGLPTVGLLDVKPGVRRTRPNLLGEVAGFGKERSWAWDARPLVILHEMMHGLGFRHSPGCQAAGAGPWPDDPASILGFGYNAFTSGPFALNQAVAGFFTSPGYFGGPGSTYFAGAPAPGGAYDIMNYCSPKWISTRNWNKLLAAYAAEPAVSARASRASASIAVNAVILSGGRAVITDISPATGASSSKGASKTVKIRVLGNHGHTLATIPAQVGMGHGDPSEGPSTPAAMFVEGNVPAHGATGVELISGRRVLTRVNAARVRLSVSIGRISRKGSRTTIRFRARPRKAITHVEIDYAANGRRFRPVLLGATGSSVTLPSSAVKATRRARVRIVVDDGFRSARATRRLRRGR